MITISQVKHFGNTNKKKGAKDMITSKASRFYLPIAFIAGFVCVALMTTTKVHAAVDTCTWTGGGADNNFTTTGNWSGCDNSNIPEDGDALVFDALVLTQDETVANDLVGATFSGITVSNSSSNYERYTIGGNAFSLSGDVAMNETTERILVAVDVTVVADGVRLAEVQSTGSLAIGTNNVILEDSSFDGGLSGSGTLTIDVPSLAGGLGGGCATGVSLSAAPFFGDSTGFSGPIVLSGYASLSVIELATTVGRNASSITIGPNAAISFKLDAGVDSTFAVPMTFNGGALFATQNYESVNEAYECIEPSQRALTVSSPVTATQAVRVSADRANIVFSGTVTGEEYFSIQAGDSGNGSLTIGGVESTAETLVTTVNDDQSTLSVSVPGNNEVIIESTGVRGSVFVSGGTLKGVGQVGSIAMSDGSVAPGLSPGCLSTGSVNYTGGSLDIELGGTTVCTEYDQQDVTGTVSIADTALSVSLVNSFVPALNDEFIILSNDDSEAVSGTFTGMDNGSSFTLDGVTYQINYDGGDGNDIVLTVTAVTATAGVPDSGIETLVRSPIASLWLVVLSGALIAAYRIREVRQK